jgi:hypothetical protein
MVMTLLTLSETKQRIHVDLPVHALSVLEVYLFLRRFVVDYFFLHLVGRLGDESSSFPLRTNNIGLCQLGERGLAVARSIGTSSLR